MDMPRHAHLEGNIQLKALLGLLLILVCPSFLMAKGQGGQAGQFLSYGVGARALAMGGAFYGVSDDATATYWNPAGLAQLGRKELTAMQATLFAQTAFNFFSYAHPSASAGTFGLSITQLNSGGFEKVDVKYKSNGEILSIDNVGSFNDQQQAIGFSWGKKLTGNYSIGMTMKNVTRKLDSSSDSFNTLDIGILAKGFSKNHRLGFGMQNLLGLKSGDTDDKLPIVIHLGNSYSTLRDRLLVSMDLDKSQSGPTGFHLGGEFWLFRWWALRVGIQGDPGIRESDFGFGIKMNNFSLDLANAIHTLGTSTRISVSWKFGQSVKDRSNEAIRRLIQEGFEAFRQGNFVLAIQKMNKALEVDPNNKQVKSMTGRLQNVVGYIPEAAGEEEANSFIRRGVAQYVDGRDLKSSINSLRYAYNKDTSNERLLNLLNMVEKEAGMDITKKPEGPSIFSLIDQKIYDARQAIYDGKYDMALRKCQEVLDLEPRNVTALELMGSAFFLIDEKDKARAVWQKVLEIDPNNKVVPEFLK